MIDTETRKAINGIGMRLERSVDCTCKVSYNFFDGKYVGFNVKLTDNRKDLNDGVRK